VLLAHEHRRHRARLVVPDKPYISDMRRAGCEREGAEQEILHAASFDR